MSMNNNTDNSLNKTIEKNNKTDYCQELKNIEYKTMLLNRNSVISDKNKNNNNNIEKITNFLDNESNANKKEPWIRLDKTQKIIKINIFINTYLSNKYNLIDEEKISAEQFLLRYLERKNLTKAKDVTYNKEAGIIQNIPNLFFNDNTRSFYFKKDDKHVSTVKSLPCDKKNKIKTLKIHDD